MNDPALQPRPAGRMRFSVDGWDPGYGTALAVDAALPDSAVTVDVNVETPAATWAPVPSRPGMSPQRESVLFVDGVRRVEARVWVHDQPTTGTPASSTLAVAASFAAGAVCCCGTAHVVTSEVRRALISTAPGLTDVTTSAGVFGTVQAHASPSTNVPAALSNALQQQLAAVELTVAIAARDAAGHDAADIGLLVIDGPIRNRTHLPRAVGYIKSHRAEYLPPQLNAVVATLGAGDRTPVFLLGTSWDRYAWYLRLPCRPGAPWAGVVRLEAAAELPLRQVLDLAGVTQTALCRFASVEYKDSRAPQNLVPIAGLERTLRHRLGDSRLVWRSLASAAAR